MESSVRTDTAKDRKVTIYLVTVGIIGVIIIVAAALRSWGYWGYFGGGFLVVSGFGGLLGKMKEGGFAVAPCPGCGAPLKFQFAKQARILQCASCGLWSEGTETMAPVPDERVADFPVFSSPLPEGEVRWPANDAGEVVCSMCDRPARFIKIEGMDPVRALGSMVLPVSVSTVHSIMVPVCDEHHDGVALLVSGSQSALGFRSRAYQLRFCAVNGVMGMAEVSFSVLRQRSKGVTEGRHR